MDLCIHIRRRVSVTQRDGTEQRPLCPSHGIHDVRTLCLHFQCAVFWGISSLESQSHQPSSAMGNSHSHHASQLRLSPQVGHCSHSDIREQQDSLEQQGKSTASGHDSSAVPKKTMVPRPTPHNHPRYVLKIVLGFFLIHKVGVSGEQAKQPDTQQPATGFRLLFPL